MKSSTRIFYFLQYLSSYFPKYIFFNICLHVSLNIFFISFSVLSKGDLNFKPLQIKSKTNSSAYVLAVSLYSKKVTYMVGDILDIGVVFNRPVKALGYPKVVLNTRTLLLNDVTSVSNRL